MLRGPGLTKVVAIAGATGFVGEALRHALCDDFSVIGLTRSPVRAEANARDDRVEWRHCDLFSLSAIETALAGVDVAIYLVHSMSPSARLVQGSFEDLDLLLADNFGRAARLAGVQQIVYLGGIIPEETRLSRHLESRLEVERALSASGPPLTSLRAGLVVGRGGASFLMLLRLVRRLPIMLLPAWTRSPTQPIALEDVVRAMRLCLGKEEFYNGHFDIGGPDTMSYRQMLRRVAKLLDRSILFLNVPFFSARLSRLWVSLVTGTSLSLVGPLVESLRHPMVATPNRLLTRLNDGATGFDEAVLASEADAVLATTTQSHWRRKERRVLRHAKTVRSVQRLPCPDGRGADWVAREYLRWLPKFVFPLLRCDASSDGVVSFKVRGTSLELLRLSRRDENSYEGREFFEISGGVLARTGGELRGRFEFRKVSEPGIVLAAIHDFTPRLPWWVYQGSQALAHLWVMRGFARHLGRVSATERTGRIDAV